MYSPNPFDLIIQKIDGLQQQVSAIKPHAIPPVEIINRNELCKRLDITEPTVIRWEKKRKYLLFVLAAMSVIIGMP